MRPLSGRWAPSIRHSPHPRQRRRRVQRVTPPRPRRPRPPAAAPLTAQPHRSMTRRSEARCSALTCVVLSRAASCAVAPRVPRAATGRVHASPRPVTRLHCCLPTHDAALGPLVKRHPRPTHPPPAGEQAAVPLQAARLPGAGPAGGPVGGAAAAAHVHDPAHGVRGGAGRGEAARAGARERCEAAGAATEAHERGDGGLWVMYVTGPLQQLLAQPL